MTAMKQETFIGSIHVVEANFSCCPTLHVDIIPVELPALGMLDNLSHFLKSYSLHAFSVYLLAHRKQRVAGKCIRLAAFTASVESSFPCLLTRLSAINLHVPLVWLEGHMLTGGETW